MPQDLPLRGEEYPDLDDGYGARRDAPLDDEVGGDSGGLAQGLPGGLHADAGEG